MITFGIEVNFKVEEGWVESVYLLRCGTLKAEPVDCFDTVADEVVGEDPPLLLL